MTRPEIRAEFRQYDGSALGHLLLVAELRALVCSGPFQGATATYRLVDDLIPFETIDVEEAKLRLVHRFFAGHGPAEITDLTRWAALTKSEVRHAIGELDNSLEMIEVDGSQLFHDPSIEAVYEPSDYLLHTFDEVTLTYPRLNFPRLAGNPMGETPGPFMDDGFAGAFIAGTECPGGWRLSTRAGHLYFKLRVLPEFHDRAEAAAASLAAYLGKTRTGVTIVSNIQGA